MKTTKMPGQRERNKSIKLQNIKSAARDLFLERSFDEATTREIARRAGVGMGTIFLYADNKRDLLFLIANDELAEVTERAIAESGMEEDPFAALIALFTRHYAYFGNQPQLSRAMLREMTFYDSGKQGQRFQTIRNRIIERIAEIFEGGQAKGAVIKKADPRLLGWVTFCIYQVELRRWLTEDRPQLNDGLRRLREALQITFDGISSK